MLGLWACLLADPKAIRAASPDELQKTHDSTQQEIKANADRIAALQDKLDKMPRKSAQVSGDGAGSNHDDFTSTQKEIVDLKNRNNDLFDKKRPRVIGCAASAAIRTSRRLQTSRDCHISTFAVGQAR